MPSFASGTGNAGEAIRIPNFHTPKCEIYLSHLMLPTVTPKNPYRAKRPRKFLVISTEGRNLS